MRVIMPATMMRRVFLTTLAVAVLMSIGAVVARAQDKSPIVVELFTSQGCSSCPPADNFLGDLAKRPDVLALSFHVDYWDYIGWKDEFGKAAYSARQKEVASWGKSRVVYTPQVVLNGRDYREWTEGALKSDLERLKNAPAKAQLHIALQPGGNGLAAQVEASVPNAADRNGAALFLALTQSNLVTPVKAGENRGVTLHHDHVVREWIGPIALDASGKAQLSRNLVLPKGAKLADLGVSAVVQRAGSGEVLQALALPACKA
jgi:hypothetical protein